MKFFIAFTILMFNGIVHYATGQQLQSRIQRSLPATITSKSHPQTTNLVNQRNDLIDSILKLHWFIKMDWSSVGLNQICKNFIDIFCEQHANRTKQSIPDNIKIKMLSFIKQSIAQHFKTQMDPRSQIKDALNSLNIKALHQLKFQGYQYSQKVYHKGKKISIPVHQASATTIAIFSKPFLFNKNGVLYFPLSQETINTFRNLTFTFLAQEQFKNDLTQKLLEENKRYFSKANFGKICPGKFKKTNEEAKEEVTIDEPA